MFIIAHVMRCFLLPLVLHTVSSFTISTAPNMLGLKFLNEKIHVQARGLSTAFRPVRRSALAWQCSSTPRPGDLTASELVKYLWNDLQFDKDYPACSLAFFSDDIVYEDMVYSKPFVGIEQVKSFLINTKEKAPEDFVFVIDKCSDGVKSCGFTWHIELKTRPDAGKFANGCSFYELNNEGKVCYIRDVVEPPIKIGSFGLVLANLAAKALKSTPPPAT